MTGYFYLQYCRNDSVSADFFLPGGSVGSKFKTQPRIEELSGVAISGDRDAEKGIFAGFCLPRKDHVIVLNLRDHGKIDHVLSIDPVKIFEQVQVVPVKVFESGAGKGNGGTIVGSIGTYELVIGFQQDELFNRYGRGLVVRGSDKDGFILNAILVGLHGLHFAALRLKDGGKFDFVH